MDRQIVYTGALPQSLDILQTNKFAMNDGAYQNRGILGTNTVVAGLACNPTSPASLQVTVGVGSIFAMDEVDATGYSDLGTDTTHNIVKQGILYDPVTLTITPPITPGYSQVFLVEAELFDVDGGNAVLPYYNAANVSQPFSGPNNSGTSQYTVRQCKCAVTLRAGAAAPTGSQITPGPDVGFVPLYAITVTYAQTQITASYIVKLPYAPFFPTLPSIPSDVQYNIWTYAIDTGVVNALAATVYPPVTQLQAGIGVFIKVANANTGPATFNLNGTGAVAIHRANGAALSSGDVNPGQVLALMYDGAAWQYLNYFGFSATTVNNNTFTLSIPYAPDTGVVNAMVGVFSPAITGLSAGNIVTVKAAFANTGPATLQCNAMTPIPILENGLPLLYRAYMVNQILFLFYDGTNFQKLNARWPYFTFDESAPPAADIPLQIGDQLNITFTNVTTIPLKTACPAAGGLFEIELMLTAQSSQNSDLGLLPNNVFTGSPAYSLYVTQGASAFMTAPPFVGPFAISNAINVNGVWNMVAAGYAPASDIMPQTYMGNDFFDGGRPQNNPADTINDLGPCYIRYILSTFPQAKIRHSVGGIRGGPNMVFGIWEDTTTPWTSLGTLIMPSGSTGGSLLSGGYATVSGTCTVKRLA